MKKFTNNDGIAPWKIDHPLERMLAKAADKGMLGKKLYVGFYKIFDRAYYQKGLTFIKKTVKDFVGDVSEEKLQAYTLDMVYSLHRFGCMFDEYFLYGFEHLNVQGREAYITDKIRWGFYERMNLDENKELFNNKRKAYERFKPYYKRDLIEIAGKDDAQLFFDFAQKHSRFIVKPIAGSGGAGVFIADTAQYDSVQALFDHLCTLGTVVVEELLTQAESMAVLHPSSLNTMRFLTMKLKDRVALFHPFVRIGKGGSIVDNAAQGGMFAAVDPESGVCITEGVDEFGHRYVKHPDTGVVLPGFQIPKWDEAVALVEELCNVVPENHYTGWDLALTDQGWVMVEGNPRAQFVIQIAIREGVKDEVNGYIAQM